MNRPMAMSKFLQRTCLALNQQHNTELFHTNAVSSVEWSRFLRKRRDSPCNSDAMTSAAVVMTIRRATTTSAAMMTSSKRFHSKFTAGQHHHPSARLGTAIPLCPEKAYELVLTLNDIERANLKAALFKYETRKVKENFEGILASTRWRTRFGRQPQDPAPLSNVDPSGDFCTFPDDWLQKHTVGKVAPPTASDLYKIFFVNAVPFVAFGFLDNFCMIMAGDYIENMMGAFMCISTMAAAGLGNTISDVLGIGTAFYVETFCTFMGLKPPELSVVQMEMKQCRRAGNFGRIIGITLGCIIGMFPLLFLKKDEARATESTLSKDSKTKKGS